MEGRCQPPLPGGAVTELACSFRCDATCGGGECAVRVLGGDLLDKLGDIGDMGIGEWAALMGGL